MVGQEPSGGPGLGGGRKLGETATVCVGDSRWGGKGLFAKRNIAQGEVVLAEKPFLTVRGMEWEGEEGALSSASRSSKSISNAVRDLSLANQELFYSFGQAPVYGEQPSAQGIFWTNMIEITEEEQQDTSCVFALTCRLNHSCSPCVKWQCQPRSDQLLTVAVRDIAEGEELSVDYCAAIRTNVAGTIKLEKRVGDLTGADSDGNHTVKGYLSQWYGFSCGCGC